MAWWDKIYTAAKTAVTNVVNAVKAVVSTVVSSVSSTVSNVKTAVSTVAQTVTTTVSNAVSTAAKKVEEVKTAVTTTTAKAVETVKAAVTTPAADAKKEADRIRNSIRDYLSRAEMLFPAIKDNLQKKRFDAAGEMLGDAESYYNSARKLYQDNAAKLKAADIYSDVGEELARTGEKMGDLQANYNALSKAALEPPKVAEIVKVDVTETRRAAWPDLPPGFPKKLEPYWFRMRDAYEKQDKEAMLRVLREIVPLSASPTPALVIIFGIVGVVSLIVTLIGSYPFAGFIREEALQTIDFAIKTAQYNKDVAGYEKAIAFKKELLERTTWEKIIGAIPVAVLMKELGDYYKAAQVKLEIDERGLKDLKMQTTGEELPEVIFSYVRDIIDGDTIDVDLNAKDAYTLRSVTLPQYGTTGHARVRIVGINAPEKTPKGEILCSDVEIYKVEGKWADEARSKLMYLNDKGVILRLDPAAKVDTHGRILAVIEIDKLDIGLQQIKDGCACRYYREPHKYVDEEKYKSETLAAKAEGIGMWEKLQEVAKEEEKIKIYIDSNPSNAKLYIDDLYTHHLTPADEKELSDVMHLLTLGKHFICAEKGGESAMVEIEIKKGDNGKIMLKLEPAPLPPKVEEVPAPKIEVPERVMPTAPLTKEPIVEERVVELDEIPAEYTIEQEWALGAAFTLIEEMERGKEQISDAEFKELVESFALYTDHQKIVLNLLFRDVWMLIRGKEVMSAAELADLEAKYRMD